LGSEDDSAFAYQFGLGLGYSINENWIIDISYKYFATEDPDFEGTKSEYDSHNITIGFRIVQVLILSISIIYAVLIGLYYNDNIFR